MLHQNWGSSFCSRQQNTKLWVVRTTHGRVASVTQQPNYRKLSFMTSWHHDIWHSFNSHTTLCASSVFVSSLFLEVLVFQSSLQYLAVLFCLTCGPGQDKSSAQGSRYDDTTQLGLRNFRHSIYQSIDQHRSAISISRLLLFGTWDEVQAASLWVAACSKVIFFCATMFHLCPAYIWSSGCLWSIHRVDPYSSPKVKVWM